MLGVVDYGAGNLRSVETALRYLGADYFVSSRPEELGAADRLVVPGVGEARAAMQAMAAGGLDTAVAEFHRSGRPLLGVCIGCQIIFERSEERSTACLGFLPGTVRRFPSVPGLKVPHMGWNTVSWQVEHPLFAGLESGAWFYFVHSYYPQPASRALVLAECEYGLRFAAAVGRENLLAVQFHPEKSGPQGLRLLSNFLDWRA
ncbi:MAG: imidazole glycerol phosphate synthase subunit HisH [Spirochaetales bacterium]|nr:imidazole glycerol phosphate synthase subunit HisH [Spirochaetales bacterium]